MYSNAQNISTMECADKQFNTKYHMGVFYKQGYSEPVSSLEQW